MSSSTEVIPAQLAEEIRNVFPGDEFVQQMLSEGNVEMIDLRLYGAAYDPKIDASTIIEMIENDKVEELLAEGKRLTGMRELYRRFCKVTGYKRG